MTPQPLEPAGPGQPMTLCVFLGSTGYHSASWRRQGVDPCTNTNVDYFISLAKTAESGGLDAVFLADSMAIWSNPAERPVGAIEPAVLAAPMLAATERIGVIITQSTTYNEPFNVARRLASLDHVGGGRIGWNIVTSATREAAQNQGLSEIPDHEERYRRGEEFVEVCIKLWNSWGGQAIHGDPQGIWADPALISSIDHNGRFFRVRGPLDVPTSPQRVPLLVQAGSSSEGIDLAAKYADWVFTVQSNADEAAAFRSRVRAQTARHDPERRIRVLPGLIPIVGETDSAAWDRLAELDELLDPAAGIRQLEKSVGLPANSLVAEDPFNMDLPPVEENAGNRTYYGVIKSMADSGAYTVGEVARLMATSRGHRMVVGSAETVAEAMIDWVVSGAADGYVLMPAALPDGLREFVDRVVPLLRAAGFAAGSSTSAGPLASRYRAPRRAAP